MTTYDLKSLPTDTIVKLHNTAGGNRDVYKRQILCIWIILYASASDNDICVHRHLNIDTNINSGI